MKNVPFVSGSGLLSVLHLAEDSDVVADENTSALKYCIPVKTPLLTTDFASQAEACLKIAPWILANSSCLNFKLYRLGYPLNGKCAIQSEVLIISLLNRCLFKLQNGVFLSIKEFGTLEMSIPLIGV